MKPCLRSGADGATPQETLRHQEPCGLDTLESDGAKFVPPSADGESRSRVIRQRADGMEPVKLSGTSDRDGEMTPRRPFGTG